MRALAVLGFGLVVLMQVIFIVNGSDRPAPYIPVQVVALIGSALLVLGAARGEAHVLAAGFALHAVSRFAQVVFGLSRLSLLLNLALLAGWVWAAVASGRGRDTRAAVWALGFLHAAALFSVLGRYWAAIALALGAAGLMLAAPSVEKEQEKRVLRGPQPPEDDPLRGRP